MLLVVAIEFRILFPFMFMFGVFIKQLLEATHLLVGFGFSWPGRSSSSSFLIIHFLVLVASGPHLSFPPLLLSLLLSVSLYISSLSLASAKTAQPKQSQKDRGTKMHQILIGFIESASVARAPLSSQAIHDCVFGLLAVLGLIFCSMSKSITVEQVAPL